MLDSLPKEAWAEDVRCLLFAVALAGCGGLPREDAKDVQDALETGAMALRYMDAQTNAGLLVCAARRSLLAVARDQKVEVTDAGGVCE